MDHCTSAAFVLLLLLLHLVVQSGRALLDVLHLVLHRQLPYYLGSQQRKDLRDVLAVLGTSLHKLEPVLLCQVGALLLGHFSFLLQVALGAHQDHVGIGVADFPDLLDPGLNVRKTVGVGDGIGEDNAMRTLVEGLGDVPEPLLAGSVPDVERYLRPFKLDPLDLEVHANGTEVVGLKGVLAVAYEQTCLSHSAVAHHEIFQSDILLVHY